MRPNFKGENNPNWKGGKIEVRCADCNKPKKVIQSVAKGQKRFFCSVKCMGLYRRRIYARKNNPNYRGGHYKSCEICGKTFWVIPSNSNQRFCSRDCYGKWLSVDLKERIEIGTYRMKVPGKDFPHPRGMKGKTHSEKTRRLLSRVHRGKRPHNKYDQMREKLRGPKNPMWLGGSSFEPYALDFNEELKEMVRNRYGRTCQLCGMKENGRKLAVHHIDYDKNNNGLSNLISLCSPCNGRVNFRRKEWIQYFHLIAKTRANPM